MIFNLARKLLVITILLFASLVVPAQVSTYNFTSTSGTYQPISGGITLDSGSSFSSSKWKVTLPFTFYYNGGAYTEAYISRHGYIYFGTSNSVFTPYLLSSLDTSVKGGIAALGIDLSPRVAGSRIRTGTIGNVGSRSFVVQYDSLTRTNYANNLNFQIRLKESDNSIEFHYGHMSSFTSTTFNIQVGIRGAIRNDFNNRTTSTSWSSSSAGTTFSAAMHLSSTVKPSSGTIYRWEPTGCPNAPAEGSISGNKNICTDHSTILTLSGHTAATTLQWQKSANGNNGWTDISGATSATYTTPLLPSSIYYRCKITCSTLSQFYSYVPSKKINVRSLEPVLDTVPYIQSFDEGWLYGCYSGHLPDTAWETTPTIGNASWRRNDNGAAANWSTPTSGMYAQASSHKSYSARWHANEADSGSVGFMDLHLKMNKAGTKQLRFDLINPSGVDSVIVEMSIDSGVTWTRLFGNNNAYTNWTTITASTTAVTNKVTFRFKARKNSSAAGSDIGIDNVRVIEPCNAAPTISNIVSNRDSACANKPDTLSINALRNPAYSIQWQEKPDGVTSWTDIIGAVDSSFIVAQNITTEYRVVATCLSTGQSTISSVKKMHLIPYARCSCQPIYVQGCGNAYIEQVIAWGEHNTGIVDSNTGCNNSYRFKNDTVSFSQGGTYDLSVAMADTALIERSIYIDFNDDAAFTKDEQLFSSYVSYQGFAARITMPVNAPLGTHVMRIGVGYDSLCSARSTGEVHDYYVKIIPCTLPTFQVTNDTAYMCDKNLAINWSGTDIHWWKFYPINENATQWGRFYNPLPPTLSLGPFDPADYTFKTLRFEVKNWSGCGVNYDTVYVDTATVPTISYIGPIDMCNKDSLLISPNVANADSFRWGPVNINTKHFYVKSPGAYTFVASNNKYCSASKSVHVYNALGGPRVIRIEETHVGLKYTFKAVVAGTGVADWNFGDGPTVRGVGVTATNTYAKPGTYTVRCLYSNNSGCPSDVATIQIVASVGINDLYNDSRLNIYPNPATDVLTVERLDGVALENIKLYDATGALLLDKKLKEVKHTISTVKYANGVYLLRAYTSKGIVSQRVVIKR